MMTATTPTGLCSRNARAMQGTQKLATMMLYETRTFLRISAAPLGGQRRLALPKWRPSLSTHAHIITARSRSHNSNSPAPLSRDEQPR